jgi:hypothetical protein
VSFFTAVKRWFAARPYLRELRARPELGFSALFDPVYYRTEYRGPWSSLPHFIVAGAFEGRDPHPLFDAAFYLRKYPDVAASGVNPLFHYLLHGAAEGRKPHPLFEPAYHAAQVAVARGNPLLAYLKTGPDSHARPHPLFDPQAYARVRRQAGPPLVDFVLHGASAVTEGTQLGQDSLGHDSLDHSGLAQGGD